MGIRNMSSIYCDKCITYYRGARNDVREVRDVARHEGWRYDREAGKDLCPNCRRK